MLHNHCMLLFLLPICVILIELCFANAYAQLADTMLCADESCSETISQGEARLAYRPKDDKFLNFKKGDVVIVKSKNAGKRSQLWGGEVMGSDRFGFFPSSFVKELIVTVKSPENSVSVQDFLNKHRSIMTKSPYANLVGENQKITIEKPKTHKMDPKDAISSSVSTDRQQAKVASDSLDSKGSENANVEKMLKENDSNANENTNINGIINDTEDTQEKSVTINQEEQDATMSVNQDIDGNSQAPSNKIKSDTVITESKANGRQQEPVLEDFKSDVGDIPPDIAILLGKTGKQEMLKKSDTTVETINTNEINKNNIKNSKESSSARMISEEVDSVKDHTLENSEESIKHDVLAATNPIASDETGPSNLSSVTNENFEGENGNDSQTSKDQEKENKEKLINQANAAGSTDLKEAQITDSDGETVVDEGHKSQQEHSKLNDSDAIIDRDSQEKENANATTDSNSEAFVRKQIEASDHKDSNAIRSADDASGGKQEHDVSSTDVVHNHDDGQTAGGTADGDPNVNSETVVEKRKGNEEELINQENRIHGGDINNVPPVTDVEGAKENVSIQDENETMTERNTDDDVNERKEDDIKRTDHDHEIHYSENSIESQSAEDNVDGNTHSKDVIDPNKENEDAITEKVNEVSEEAVSTVTSAIGTETEQVSEDATPEKLKEVPEEAASTVTGDIGTETKQIDAVVNNSVIQNPYGNENATETTGDDADKNRSIVIETKKEGDITDKKNEIDGKTVTVKESSDGSEGNQLDDVLKNDMQNLDRDLTPEENTYTDNESQAAIETIKEDENEQPDQKNVLHSNLIITAGDQNEPKQKDALKQENEDDMKGEDLSKAELKAHKFQDKESNKFQERLKEDKFFTSKSDNTTFREATEKMEDSYAKSDESSIGYNTSDSTDITAEHLIEASHTKQAEYSKSVDGAVGDASEFDSTTSTQMHNTKESKLVENDSKFAPDRNKEVSDPNTAEETKVLQMTDATSKPSNQNDQSPSKLETLSSKDDSSEEDYKPLHEGKVVNWDESLQSTKKPSEGLGWDETIGKTNENKTLDDHDVIPSTREETGNQLTTKSDVDSTTDILASANTEKDDFPSANDADASKDSKTKDEQHLMSTGSGEEEKDSTTVTKTSDAINADSDRNIVDEQSTVSPDEASEITVANTSYERTEDAGHTETNTQESFIEESRPEGQSDEMHVESLPLRILLLLSKFPYDMQYVMEPFFKLWVSLLPEEYQNDVHGVSWMVIGSTMFVGCLFIWMFLWRMKSSSRKRKEAQAAETVKELRLQLEAVIQEKLEKENELKEKQCEVESKREELDSANQNTSLLTTEKSNMQRSFNEFSSQYEQLRQTLESLTGELDQKNNYISELLDKHQSLEKARDTQQQLLSDHEKSLSNLENHVKETEERKRGMEATINKQKEKIKALEKAKGDTKKEGKSWKDQAEKLNEKILLLEERLNAEVTENEQSKQEIDVLKDCLLQLRGVQEALGSDEDGEMSVENQKEKLKALIDVYEIKTVLKQTEAQKAQKTYELEAERKSRTEIEAKISELEGEIQCSDAMKNKLEHDKQLLESKLAVMQEFYAKREVEIQSKLGMEQTKLETNSYLLEERQQQQMELVKQLEIYKNMNEGSKRQYEDAERKHKQEIVAFEKKAHENWLACREAERKHDEASKQINQLHMELADLQHRLHIEREPIIRPRPERHGPPGGPPPFGPSRRGIPPSPVHFRNGPPDTGRRSPMISRRPPSPGNSLNEDLRSQSPTGRPRPDRPPSAQSLPPADRRPPSHGPFIPPASHGPPGRGFGPYREGIPPRPLLHRPPYPHLRGPPDSRHRDPAFSSPYMDRPTIALSKSPGPNFTNNTQGSLHAPPPVITGSDRSALRNDGAPPMSYSTPTNEGPPLSEHKPGASGPNPFRRV